MDTNPSDMQRLLMAANLHRLRGELNEAETMVRAALSARPADHLAREMLGDLLTQKGDYDSAALEYRTVLQDSPGRASVEEKLARLILKSHPAVVAEASGRPLRTDRNPITVAVLSLVFPGVGHFYLGDRIKGVLFSAAALILCLLMVPSLIGAITSVSGTLSRGLSPDGLVNGGLQTPTITGGVQVTLYGLALTGLYLWATIDAYVTARRVARR